MLRRRINRFVILIVVPACALAGQSPQRPWREILEVIRKNVASQIVRQNNYICVQDLSRYYYMTKTDEEPCEQPPHVSQSRLAMRDRLRLDVTVSEGSEIYGWHGEDRLSSKNLVDIVQHGPVSSGGFTGYLRNVFVEAGIEFSYQGITATAGKQVYNFGYRVAQKVSRYQVKAAGKLIIVPFHGSFTASAEDLQLETLVVTADGESIPRNAELCAIQSTVTYKLARISAADSLIPSSFDMIYGSHQRSVTESKGEYSGCREFSGESTVHFDAEDPAGGDARTENEAGSLRPGRQLRIALTGDIDSETAYAGMPVEGTLAHPAKIGNGVVLPAGSRVYGILTRFETHFLPEPQTVLILEFDRLKAANKTYTFRALHPPDLFQLTVSSPGPRLRPRQVPASSFEEEPGVLIFPKARLHLDRRFVTEYETVAVK